MEEAATAGATGPTERTEAPSEAADSLAADIIELRGSQRAVQLVVTFMLMGMDLHRLDRLIPALEAMRKAMSHSSKADQAAMDETLDNILDWVRKARDARRPS